MPKPPKSQPAQKTQSKLNRTSAAANTKLDLSSFESFRDHPLVIPSIQRYHRDVILADAAVKVLVTDLENLNEEHEKSFGRVAFITIEGRVKTEDSFLKKLYIETRESSKSRGITAATLSTLYAGIKPANLLANENSGEDWVRITAQTDHHFADSWNSPADDNSIRVL